MNETKPALKSTLRQIISDIEKRKAGIDYDTPPSNGHIIEERESKYINIHYKMY